MFEENVMKCVFDKHLVVKNIFSEKLKTIKEKNIANEITKYEIKIILNVKYRSLPNGASNNFIISKYGDFNVTAEHLNTLNNEKK